MESVERRFNESPDKKKLVEASKAHAALTKSPEGFTPNGGWKSFPPRGLSTQHDIDLQPALISGPNNGQISSAKLYASNGN